MKNSVGKVIPKSILKFLQGLIIEKGHDNLPANIQADILLDLYTRYNDYLTVGFLNAMDDQTRDNFNKLLENNPKQEEIMEFFKENIDYKKVVKETTEEFRNIYLGRSKKKS